MTRRLASETKADEGVVRECVRRVRVDIGRLGILAVAGVTGVHPDTLRNWTREAKATTPSAFTARVVLGRLDEAAARGGGK